MPTKKSFKGVYVLFAIWGAMILFMAYTLGDFGDLTKLDKEMIAAAENKREVNRAVLSAANGAYQRILSEGKIINKGINADEYDNSGWYHIIYEGNLFICEAYLENGPKDQADHVITECFTSKY